jgi:diguanylate cyclase (GGDEF)-like protein
VGWALISVFLLGCLNLAALYAVLHRVLLGPLMDLDAHILRMEEEGDFSARLDSRRRDEIGELSGSFDFMLAKVEQVTAELRKANAELALLAVLDPLTGVANRRKFDEALSVEWNRHRRTESPLSLVMIDVDCFKSFNDRYGHQAGDEALLVVSGILSKCVCRAGDLAARYGGEEFVAVLTNTSETEAMRFAELLRIRVYDADVRHDSSPVADRLTVSAGIATVVPTPLSEPADLVRAADGALYEAKRSGRNQAAFREV